MVHGAPISVIVIVKLRFHIGATNLTIHSHFYHFPNDHARLLIPQQFSSSHGEATGTFTIGDKFSVLSLDVKPYPQFVYDSRSYLHVYLACNATASYYPNEVNLSVISNENKTLTPSK